MPFGAGLASIEGDDERRGLKWPDRVVSDEEVQSRFNPRPKRCQFLVASLLIFIGGVAFGAIGSDILVRKHNVQGLSDALDGWRNDKDRKDFEDANDADLLYAPGEEEEEVLPSDRAQSKPKIHLDEEQAEEILKHLIEEVGDERQDNEADDIKGGNDTVLHVPNEQLPDSHSEEEELPSFESEEQISQAVEELSGSSGGLRASSDSFWNTQLARLFPSNTDLMNELLPVLANYAKWHEDQLRKPTKNTKYLIYTCHESCGGIGNRLMGIMSMLAVAVETDRVFGIDWSHPFALEDTLVPGLIDWKAAVEKVGSNKRSEHIFIHHGSLMAEVQSAEHAKVYRAIDSKITFNDIVRRGHKLKNSVLPTKFGPPGKVSRIPRLATLLFKMLFRPSDEIQEFIMQNSKSLGFDLSQPYIGVHMRLGAQGSSSSVSPSAPGTHKHKLTVAQRHDHFVDSRPRHSMTDVPKFVHCARNMARNFMGRRRGTPSMSKALPQVFLSSDSVPAKLKFALNGYGTNKASAAENMTTPFFFNEVAIHIEQNGGNFRKQFFETAKRAEQIMWSEIFITAGAKCAVLSKSSFSFVAMVIGEDIKSTADHCEAYFDDCSTENIQLRLQNNPRISWEVEQGMKYHYWRGKVKMP